MPTRPTDAYRLSVALELDAPAALELEPLIAIFHRWIQRGALDELLIDVADYRHVPGGPGVMLVAHEAHYGVEDVARGRWRLRYARKRPASGGFSERLRDAVARALAAGRLLEQEPALAGLEVRGDRFELAIDDRLLAPDGPETFAAIEPPLRALVGELYGGAGCELRREEDPGGPFAARVRLDRGRPRAAALLERLSAGALPVAV